MSPVLYLLIVSLGSLVHAGRSRSLEDTDNDDLMAILKSSKEHLKELEKGLEIMYKKLESNSLTNQRTDLQAQSFVQILEVTRTVVGGDYKYSVQYRRPDDVLHVYWINTSSIIPDVQREVTPGVIETSVVIDGNHKPDSVSIVMGSDKQRSVFLNFDLGKQKQDAATVLDLVLPVLQIEPSGDIVYLEGSNTSLKVTTTLCGTMQPDLMFTSEMIDLRSDDTGKVRIQDIESMIDKNISSERNTSREITINIPTSLYPMSGLLNFQLYCPENNAHVFSVWIQQSKVLRPATQEGPFPPRFLSIKESVNEWNGKGENIIPCNADEPCRLYCKVLGENVTEVNLVKISQDGTRTDVVGDDGYDSVYQSFNNGVRRLKSAVVTGDIDFYTGVKFECSADNIYGDHVTRDISVFIPPKLVKEHSEITVVRAQDNSDAVMLNLTCTVKAQTRGSVTFSWGGDNILSNHWEEVPDVITALPGNEYMATKLVAFDPADESTKLKYASCSAGGSLTSYGDSLSLEIPDTEILSA